MRIAITNDDGVDAPGIYAIASRLESVGHEIIVVAPSSDMSGSGSSTGGDLRVSGGVRTVRHRIGSIEALAVDGPPALCALLALRGAVGDPPKLLVSGINAGPNLGPSVFHSGTVSAALTAANFGLPALAVSLVHETAAAPCYFETAAAFTEQFVSMTAEDAWTPTAVANINVPDLAAEQIAGWSETELAPTPGFRSIGISSRELEEGANALQFRYERDDESLPHESDVMTVRAGLVSITWLQTFAAATRPSWFQPDRLVFSGGLV
jgi:5'-nucleotidase